MAREYKCWFNRCSIKIKCDDKDIVKIKNRRYHKKCYQNLENLKKLRELYIEYLQPSVVHAQLNKVINTLIDEKKVEIDFLLFVIEYLIENDIEINYPYSLYYKVSDYRILKAYKNIDTPQTGFKIYS